MSDSAAKQVELLTETNLLIRLAACERELEERSAELSELKKKRSLNWLVLLPLLVATIGAPASIVFVAVSQYLAASLEAESAEAVAALQRESQQATLERELLKITLEAHALRSDSNLRFLAISRMIPTFRSSVLDTLDGGFSFSVAHGRGGEGFSLVRKLNMRWVNSRRFGAITLADLTARRSRNCRATALETHNSIAKSKALKMSLASISAARAKMRARMELNRKRLLQRLLLSADRMGAMSVIRATPQRVENEWQE